MKIVILAATVLALPLQTLSAHPRLSSGPGGSVETIHARHVTAYVGEPRARIRTFHQSEGLGPLAFAEWLVRHQKLFPAETALLHRVSSSNDLIDRSAGLFSIADSNSDRRISAIELADFVAIDPAKALTSQSWATKASP